MDDERLFSAACERNREPILAVLRDVLPSEGVVLEIASGTGMHASWFAPRLPGRLRWQPSDFDARALASIEAWRRTEPTDKLEPPVRLDVTADRWPVDRADAIFCSNLIHISPWKCTVGLFAGAARITREGAPLILYGPFAIEGEHTAPSNARFDESLRSRDPAWGVRDLEEVTAAALEAGFERERAVPMPANNLTVVFRRTE